MSKDLLKWAIWAGYMIGLLNLVTWLDALNAPLPAWIGLLTVMFGAGVLNAIGYPFGPEVMRANRRELWERARGKWSGSRR